MAKTLYDILDVPLGASAEQIRDAYLLRSKLLHPDRFDPAKQRAEWDLANSMLKELNHAYGVLRDTTARARYDDTITGQSTKTQPQQERRTQSSPPKSSSSREARNNAGQIRAGHSLFTELPPGAQQRLIERVKGENKVQYAVRLRSGDGNVFWAAAACSWLVVMVWLASLSRWSNDAIPWVFAITCIAALIFGFNANQIIRWYRSPLRSWLLVTPLYVVRTHFDKVWYWPIWELSEINATHHYYNGFYRGTSLFMAFGGTREEFSIWRRGAFESLQEALQVFSRKNRSAVAAEDWSHFSTNDDFAGARTASSQKKPRRFSRQLFLCLGSSLFVFGVTFVACLFSNEKQPPSYVQQSQYPEPPKQLFSEPQVPLPSSGSVRRFIQAENVAPLEIQSPPGINYLVKLVELPTRKPALTVFIQGGQPINIDVPLGTYLVRYAAGKDWYGETFLFGPDTTYSEADETFIFQKEGDRVSGYTITLFKVRNGNLRTRDDSAWPLLNGGCRGVRPDGSESRPYLTNGVQRAVRLRPSARSGRAFSRGRRRRASRGCG
jgi:hypothetical protein